MRQPFAVIVCLATIPNSPILLYVTLAPEDFTKLTLAGQLAHLAKKDPVATSLPPTKPGLSRARLVCPECMLHSRAVIPAHFVNRGNTQINTIQAPVHFVWKGLQPIKRASWLAKIVRLEPLPKHKDLMSVNCAFRGSSRT